MNWLTDLNIPGVKKMFRGSDDNSDSLWVKCKNCEEMIFHADFALAQQVCHNCGHHMHMPAKDRLDKTFDDANWEKIELPDVAEDPLKFKDEKKYTARMSAARKKTGEKDALLMGCGKIDGVNTVVVVQNFAFMGGSMGMALGEGILKAAEKAIEEKAAFVIFTASGGARMQEGILSLMQMPRTTIAVQMLAEANLPYLVVLTHPTTGGVTASYAMLGDVQLAEPGALIGFAGPRVIEQTIREKLPPEFQKAEFLNEKGMVDAVVHRHEMKETLSSLIRVLMKKGEVADNVTPLLLPQDSETSDEVQITDQAAE